jgi:hypothetical protein
MFFAVENNNLQQRSGAAKTLRKPQSMRKYGRQSEKPLPPSSFTRSTFATTPVRISRQEKEPRDPCAVTKTTAWCLSEN